MDIDRQDFDRLPFAIRQGALLLWGTELLTYSRFEKSQRLFSFSGFYAEMCFEGQQLVGISTFSTIDALDPYIEEIELASLLY